jgi:DNA-binding SARP family transcriptional activator/CheY-like chemotaxis protein
MGDPGVPRAEGPLSLTLFGHFAVTLPDGREITIPTRKAQGLLTYLALNPDQRFGRAHIAGLLWGDSVESLARNSLRQTLFTIRRSIGPQAGTTLRVELDTIGLNRDAVRVDVWELIDLLAANSRAAIERATALYRGDLLAGFYLNEPGFDDWMTAERERLRVRVFEALASLLRMQTDEGDLPAATRTAERLTALDPLDEAAHRALIRLLLKQGFRGAALRQYRTCADLLDRELGVTASPETLHLHEEILRHGGGDITEPLGPDMDLSTDRQAAILIVEDDRDQASLLEGVLRAEGYRVRIADSGADALDELAASRFDVVLADIRMPGMDGLELLEEVRRRHGDTHTILMTARRGDHWELKSLELGAADYIAKPFRTDVLLLRLKNLLRRVPGVQT